MSSYPPPPQPDQQHYNPIYDTGNAVQHILDPEQQEQLRFAAQLTHATSDYAKIEHEGLDPTTSSQIEQRIEQLQHQQSLESEQLHQHQHDLTSNHHPDVPHLDQHDQQPQTNGSSQKLFRLRKACDSCSIRKVKCDEAGPPCKACAALDIPCTFDRPSRRRGPPNRHAEAVKRRRLDEDTAQALGQPLPSSPTHAAQALAALSSHPAQATQLSAESMLPVDTMDAMINDYFTYIHPLCPFPHEPSFREAWRRREDLTNRPFLALLGAMVATFVASVPRRARQLLRNQYKGKAPNTIAELIRLCLKVAAEARGPGYMHSEALTVHDAATSYLMGLSSGYSGHTRECRLYIGECLNIIKSVGLNKSNNNFVGSGRQPGQFPEDVGKPDFDNITLQVGRRVWWTAFVSSRSMSQFGLPGEAYIPPSTASDPYPPLPLEVEDFCIFPGHIEPQPPGLTSNIAGFNANVRMFLAYQPLVTMELVYGLDHDLGWAWQKSIYRDCLIAVRKALDNLPKDLQLTPAVGDAAPDAETFAAFQYRLSAKDNTFLSQDQSNWSPEQRRRLQQGIQQANCYTTGLSTLMWITEKFLAASAARGHKQVSVSQDEFGLSPNMRKKFERLLPVKEEVDVDDASDLETEIALERDLIVRKLMILLGTLEREFVEPNGESVSHKIRFIASTLIDVPHERKGSVALQADTYVRAFLELLVRLARNKSDAYALEIPIYHTLPEEGTSPMATGSTYSDSENQTWADLREYQAKFASEGMVEALAP